jgi:hypothetical protein
MIKQQRVELASTHRAHVRRELNAIHGDAIGVIDRYLVDLVVDGGVVLHRGL